VVAERADPTSRYAREKSDFSNQAAIDNHQPLKRLDEKENTDE